MRKLFQIDTSAPSNSVTSFLLRLGLAVVLACSVGTCEKPENDPVAPALMPTAENALSEVHQVDQVNFYYYKGPDSEDRIPVTRDRSAITVTLEPGSDGQTLDTALDDLELSASTRELSVVRGRWRLTYPPAADSIADVRLEAVRALPGVRFASYRLELPQGPVELSGQLAVEFNRGIRRDRVIEIAELFDLELAREPIPGRWDHWRFWLPTDADPLTVAAAVHEHSDVDWADLDWAGASSLGSPSDPLFQYQYYLENSDTMYGVNVDINVQPAWDSAVVGDGVKVAVIDIGVEADHEDMGFLVSAGWDAVPYAPDTIGYKPLNCDSFCATKPEPTDPHGTWVAGIILGQHDNSIGIAGIAPYSEIFPVRITRTETTVWATYPDIAEAIDVAWAEEGVDVINGSWQVGESSAIADAISDAYDDGRGGLGTVVVFSAGNDSENEVAFPASLSTTIAVGAITKTGDHAGYSNHSSTGKLDLVAPSSPSVVGDCAGDLVTTDLQGNPGCNGAQNNDLDYTNRFGGTSAAAPQVAAAAALLISLDPDLTSSQVSERLRDFADWWYDRTEFGEGKLNIGRSLFPPEGPSATLTGQTTLYQNETCTWVVTPSGDSPFTYRWYRDGSWLMSEDDSVYTASVGTADFMLVAQVYDTWGQLGADTLTIDVTTSEWDLCMY